MASLWQFIATFALPAPIGLLILLNLPVPKYVTISRGNSNFSSCLSRTRRSTLVRTLKKSVVGFVARVFEFPVLGNTIKLLHLMLLTLAGALFMSVQTLTRLQEQAQAAVESTTQVHASPLFDAVRLNKRWRAERNLWLSAFAFTMWTVLAVFYREMARRLRVEDRLAEFETSDCTGTIDSTMRDVSVSKEVTSRPNVLSPRTAAAARSSPFAPVGAAESGSPLGIKEAMKALSDHSGGSSGGRGADKKKER